VILCTGWKDGFSPYSPELRGELGLPSPVDRGGSWAKLDAEANARVDELLPNLTSIPHETPQSVEHKETAHRPWRLYRRLVSPSLADAGDRSVLVLGQIHSVYTPLVAELQALWGSAFLLGHIDMPSVEKMKQEVAVWNAWTAKRYLAQGRRHAYSIYDYLAVSSWPPSRRIKDGMLTRLV
jgi:dimethylaniline monooxygenase (N-oxide forming)